jgi:hypothetical protein
MTARADRERFHLSRLRTRHNAETFNVWMQLPKMHRDRFVTHREERGLRFKHRSPTSEAVPYCAGLRCLPQILSDASQEPLWINAIRPVFPNGSIQRLHGNAWECFRGDSHYLLPREPIRTHLLDESSSLINFVAVQHARGLRRGPPLGFTPTMPATLSSALWFPLTQRLSCRCDKLRSWIPASSVS